MLDLGRWWKGKYGLPLPLGRQRSAALAASRDPQRMLPPDAREHSIRARQSRRGAEYALQFARDMEPRLAEKFVGMYVNHYTLDAGEVVPKAVQKLLDLGYEAGLIPTARGSGIRPLIATLEAMAPSSCVLLPALSYRFCLAALARTPRCVPKTSARWERAAPTPFPNLRHC